jgi:hypothetical protein
MSTICAQRRGTLTLTAHSRRWDTVWGGKQPSGVVPLPAVRPLASYRRE